MLEAGVPHSIKEIPKQRSWRLIVLQSLVRAGQVGPFFDFNLGYGCVYDKGSDHAIEDCQLFEEFVTILIKRGIVRFPGARFMFDVSAVDQKESYRAVPYKYPIPFNIQLPTSAPVPTPGPPTVNQSFDIVLCPPPAQLSPFNIILPTDPPYVAPTTDQVSANRTSVPTHNPASSSPQPPSIDLITRSGRVLVPSGPGETSNPQKGDDVFEHVDESMRIVHKSDYSIIDQLHRTPSRISLLELIKSSAVHREALHKILRESYVADHITPEGFSNMVGQVRMVNYISFSDEEIDPRGRIQTRALYITVKHKGFMVAKVLIDNGSALNILPASTISALSIDQNDIRSDPMVAKAFDGSQRGILEAIDLEIIIGGQPFQTTFHILDIEPNYTMLLGRPWIHMAGAVPSTLHQKVKFIANGRLIVVKGEEPMLVSTIEGFPYVEQKGEILEPSFTSFEVISAEEGSPDIACKKGGSTFYELLYANHEFPKPWEIAGNTRRFGLGYLPKEGNLLKSKGKAHVPPIEESFYSAGSSTSPIKGLIDQMESLDVKDADACIEELPSVEGNRMRGEEEEDFAFNLHGMFN